MKTKRMLVTGAAGMVGSYLTSVFHDVEMILTDITDDYKHLDVRDPEAVMNAVQKYKPDTVLHLAAATDVDQCQKEPDTAYHTNAIGTQNVALACQKTNTLFVYVSTAGVFWGDKPNPYTEFDPPKAKNIYGDSKYQGEKIVTSLLSKFFICRAGWMIGGGKKDKKFVGKIAKLIAEGKTEINAVNDKYGSATYGKDLLSGIRSLMETDYYGLYHMVNKGTASRYEVALEIRDILGTENVQVRPVNSAHFPLPAPRARSEKMFNYKLDLLGTNTMRSWQEALKEYISEELAPALTNNIIPHIQSGGAQNQAATNTAA